MAGVERLVQRVGCDKPITSSGARAAGLTGAARCRVKCRAWRGGTKFLRETLSVKEVVSSVKYVESSGRGEMAGGEIRDWEIGVKKLWSAPQASALRALGLKWQCIFQALAIVVSRTLFAPTHSRNH